MTFSEITNVAANRKPYENNAEMNYSKTPLASEIGKSRRRIMSNYNNEEKFSPLKPTFGSRRQSFCE